MTSFLSPAPLRSLVVTSLSRLRAPSLVVAPSFLSPPIPFKIVNKDLGCLEVAIDGGAARLGSSYIEGIKLKHGSQYNTGAYYYSVSSISYA